MSPAGRGIVFRQIDRLFGEGTLTGLGDGPLLERYLTRRDEDAFEALVDLHGPMVLGLCRRMLRDPRDIEDAFQATFLVLARKAPAIRDRDRLSSWLYGVAYRVARRARSRTLRRRERESAVGVPEVAAEPEPERAEIDPMLDQELSRLPERYREPLVLCYLRGRTHEQAAEDLSCPVGTVRSRLARGRDLLRDRLTRRGFAPSALGAILGGDAMLPARLLVETVPPSLAAATVRAAVGFGAPSILKVGAAAATSVTLARGVLTTMKLAQLKWIGIATMVAGLSAGGVVTLGYASATGQDVGGDVPKGAVAVDYDRDGRPDLFVIPGRGQKTPGAPAPPSMTDARLKTLEEKIDTLLGRTVPPPSFETRLAPSQSSGDQQAQPDPRMAQQPARPGQAPASAMPSIEELEVELDQADSEVAQIRPLIQGNTLPVNTLQAANHKRSLVAARVSALDQEFQDETERLQLERNRKAAQLARAEAEVEVANALVKRNEVLNQRKTGMVAAEEVARADGQLKIARASGEIARVEVAEVDLRLRQLDRKRERMKGLVERARAVKQNATPARGANPGSNGRP